VFGIVTTGLNGGTIGGWIMDHEQPRLVFGVFYAGDCGEGIAQRTPFEAASAGSRGVGAYS
jgi:hypothetical protein